MVSEDSQHCCWLAEVHRLSDLRDLDNPLNGEVPTESHQLDDLSELGEVVSLRGSQWVRLEEGAETALPINEPYNPTFSEESFLLVFRTRCVFTVIHAGDLTNGLRQRMASRTEIHRVFQHMADFSSRSHLRVGQRLLPAKRLTYLRTVIVHGSPMSPWGVDHIFIPRLQRGSSAYGL
jgi:hypothetical protein